MFSFHRFGAYQKAFQYHSRVYRLLKANPRIERYMHDQVGRSALSVVANIAEGSGTLSLKARRNYYVIARASLFENVALLDVLQKEFKLEQATIDGLQKSAEEISVLLYSVIRKEV